jgi:ComF family protein
MRGIALIARALPGEWRRRKCGDRLGGMALAQSLEPLLDLVFPPRCPLCGEGVAAHGGLCAACWASLVVPGAPACRRCQRPFAHLGDIGGGMGGGGAGGGGTGMECAPCLAAAPRHDGIAAGTVYNPASRQLVLAFKHGGRIALAPMLARLIFARLADLPEDIGAGWLVVPVPLHRWRLWKRGYNQAAVLGRELARQTGARLLPDALLRTKATPTLGGLSKAQRARALAGTIRPHPGRRAMLKGAKVLLVDDVLTSGATTDACIRALRRAGAEKVVIACIARVMDEALPHL